MADIILGGIEGGGTVSTISLFNGKGERLSELTGVGTNYLTLGMDVVHDRINALVQEAKKTCQFTGRSNFNSFRFKFKWL